MTETTTVRENLMTEQHYAPYCGSERCGLGMQRAPYNTKLEQFKCGCGWVSEFPKDFIYRYKLKWNK